MISRFEAYSPPTPCMEANLNPERIPPITLGCRRARDAKTSLKIEHDLLPAWRNAVRRHGQRDAHFPDSRRVSAHRSPNATYVNDRSCTSKRKTLSALAAARCRYTQVIEHRRLDPEISPAAACARAPSGNRLRTPGGRRTWFLRGVAVNEFDTHSVGRRMENQLRRREHRAVLFSHATNSQR